MEFEASTSTGAAHKKKQNKNKKKKGKQGNNELCQTKSSNEDEFAAFLFLLDMTKEDVSECTPSSSWIAQDEQEALMSINYIKSLTSHDNGLLEAEFVRHFRTHVALKKYLSNVEMRSFKDRIFLLMAKEKETDGDDAQSQILHGHFLYEELRLQHQYLTTAQDTDAPNDTAFKVTMVPVVCGLIRNCNESRDTVCLDVKGDEEESAALFRAPMAPPGSCLASVLRPLYKHLQSLNLGEKKADADADASSCSLLSSELRALCHSDMAVADHENVSIDSSRSNTAMFFEGPPEWHHNLPFFMKRVQYSKPSPERMGFVKHALRTAQSLRVMQEQKLFYDEAYRLAHRHVPGAVGEKVSGDSYATLELPFTVHVMLHRAARSTVSLKPSATMPSDSDCINLAVFKRLMTIQLPRVLVVPCSRCAIPCTGECVCGTRYCSPKCLEADSCRGCAQGCAQELKYLTPVSWGRAPLSLS